MITAAPSLADRFAWLFDGLCRVIGVDAQKQRLEAALAWAIWNRVRLLGDRLIALAERVRAGREPRRRVRKEGTSPRPSPQGGEGEVQKPGPCTARLRLPREFGWARRMLPETGQYAGVLQVLLRDPETVALLAKAPQAGRMLRPLCHLLGVRTPEFLRRGAVVPQETATPVVAEAAQSLDPRLTPALSTPGGGEREGAEAPVAEERTEVAPPPQPAPSAEEAALAYARRPGGLYWDGTRMRWS